MPSKIEVDDILILFLSFFKKNKALYFSELPTKQTVHMMFQALFSLKI